MALITSISGIRGTIGGKEKENLTPLDIVRFTAAFAVLLREQHPDKNELTIVLGRDARVSGKVVSALAATTLQSMGIHVIDVGLSTTPSVEMAVKQLHANGGVIITASHNPKHWNALKLLNQDGEFISREDGNRLLVIANDENFCFSDIDHLGNYSCREDSIENHINEILQLPAVRVDDIRGADFSVIVDGVNSTGSLALPSLLHALGVTKVTLLNGELTGQFAHNPEPLPEHLSEISKIMQSGKYHVGFVCDPDVDRLAILTEKGEMFGEEYTLVAIADYILQQKKGCAVSNLSSTRALKDLCAREGVDCYQAAVGEVNVVNLMKTKHAIIGGEGNGGVIYPELHYGRDALVGVALFLSYMATSRKSCLSIRQQYPDYYISKNKIDLPATLSVQKILDCLAKDYSREQIDVTDGIKIDFKDSWIHLRPSNTEPIIRVYAEAKDKTTAEALYDEIYHHIKNILFPS
ncbi:MAG: phosphoglucosamine mutase [Bacteroidales bacterium]|jgi:phosphomannomutase|nr:phosphoglucosamine mutase [Bacteroidales bacterium]